jgi:hypothetical protein
MAKTMEEALRVKERIEAEILGRPGVTGIDVGYYHSAGPESREPAIRIYVADRGAAPPFPEEIDGVPVVVIERRFELH